MPSVSSSLRPFVPGTTGWTAADLDDPEIESLWVQGSYEIVKGVLTTMPPAYFLGGQALFDLMVILRDHFARNSIAGSFATEVEIFISNARLPRADAAMLTPLDRERQIEAAARAGREDADRTRLLIPPTLIIESVSPGHEAHDRRTKKSWYAEFGVPNYWILDAFARTLECYRLSDKEYRLDSHSRDQETVNPPVFPGLSIPLSRLWKTAK